MGLPKLVPITTEIPPEIPSPSSPFYLVRQRSGSREPIQIISPLEAELYRRQTGYLPAEPKTVLVGGGGAVKAYKLIGLNRAFHEHGIIFDGKNLSSASSLLALLDVPGMTISEVENFAFRIPELLQPYGLPLWARGASKVASRKYSEKIQKLGQFSTALKSREIKTSNNGSIKVNQGIVNSRPLEEKLREYCGDIAVGDTNSVIMAIDYTDQRIVFLGIDFPEMPLYKAIGGAIAMQPQMQKVEYKGHLFGDGAAVYHFPLLPHLIPENANTVIAVMLRSNGDNGRKNDYSGFSGFTNDVMVLHEVYKEEMARQLSQRMSGKPYWELVNGDENLRICLLNLQFEGIPSGTISIPESKRLEFMVQGHQVGEEVVRRFRIV